MSEFAYPTMGPLPAGCLSTFIIRNNAQGCFDRLGMSSYVFNPPIFRSGCDRCKCQFWIYHRERRGGQCSSNPVYYFGAIGVVEAGFVNSHSPFTIEVHGTEGTLLFGTPEDKLLLKTNKPEGTANSWTEIPIKDNHDSAFHQWVNHIQSDTFADNNVQTAIELTRLMEAANRSAKEGRVIPLADVSA